MTTDTQETTEETINPFMMFQGVFIQNYILMSKDLTDQEKLMLALSKSIPKGESIELEEAAERLGWEFKKALPVYKKLRKKELL